MKFAVWLVLLPLAAAGQNLAGEPARMTAGRTWREGNVLRGSGRVQVRIGPLLVEGDEGRLNSESDEVEVRGHARVTLPARSDRTLLRYSSSGLVTEQEVGLRADRLTIRYGLLLRGRGHVDARTDKGRLQADEIDLYLKIGDGEVRGNVRLNGDIPGPPARTFFDRGRFPPDIVK